MTLSLFPTSASADIEDLYRYSLTRVWDPQLLRTCWLMLNPSIADAEIDDPTIRRCAGFSRAFGHGSFVVANLFALRSTEPKALYAAADPVGPRNDEAILMAASNADVVIAAWGAHGALHGRSKVVRSLLAQHGIRLTALTINKGGEPGHPLYLSGKLRPQPFPLAA